MHSNEPAWVPKIHPLERDVDPEDPMELLAQPVEGDPFVMLGCILEEFAWMGWNRDQLLGLFRNPGYPVLCQLREYFGDDEVQRQVEALVSRRGVLRFSAVEAEPEPHEDHLELVQLDFPSH
jgi:hypothetical protein